MSLEKEFVNVECFELNESGSIVIEKAYDKYTLESEEKVIDLKTPYQINENTIVQGEITIDLENEQQLAYFNTILEEINNG